VLEAGGGIGAVEVELLEAGAARAVNVELSREYEEAAGELLAERGLEERVERRFGDFTALELEPADAVVMCRVVCCYPDYERLVGTAADRARRLLVFTHPPDGLLAHAVTRIGNLLLRLSRQEFRMYAHSVPAMRAVAERHGFRHVAAVRRPIWSVECFERFPGGNVFAQEGAGTRRT
jgi:magnesium-protoporphyrin O-methyltransferase